jgi:hypothetical protein
MPRKAKANTVNALTHQPAKGSRAWKVKRMEERDEMRARIMVMVAQGMPPALIARDVGIDERSIRRHITAATDALVQFFASPEIHQTFARYAAFNLDLISRLQTMQETFLGHDTDKKQYSAFVSSIKTQAEIYDRIINKGMDFGVIDNKRANRSQSSDKGNDIKVQLQLQINTLNQMLRAVTKDDPPDPKKPKRGRPPKKKYTKIVRKVRRDHLGIVYRIKDWRFRRDVEEDRTRITVEEPSLSPDSSFAEVLSEQVQLAAAISRKPNSQNKETTTEVIELTPSAQNGEEETWLVKPSQKKLPPPREE